jgi:hypothetical protein
MRRIPIGPAIIGALIIGALTGWVAMGDAMAFPVVLNAVLVSPHGVCDARRRLLRR